MSVINKMLRDLDSRQAAGTVPLQTPESRTGMARGTLIVNDSDRARRRRGTPRVAVVMAAAVMVLGGTAGTWWYRNQLTLAPTTSAVGLPVIAVAPVAAPALQQKVAEPAISSVSATSEPAQVPQKLAIVASPVAAKLPVAESGAAHADLLLKMDSTFRWVPSPDPAARATVAGTARPVAERSLVERSTTSASTAAAAVMAVPPSPPRQSPALETLAQAQSLWNSGSHEAAIDLLREALTVAERASIVGAPAGNQAVVAALARELARMELAEGRASQALEMLTRLEPALSGFADVWAIRGNAAQRLGRHQESAAAYLMALKLRPDEPRWMLGAAVSLAAQGQTAAAAELAEKARAGGVLSREVATYLRQLGVSLHER